MQRQEVANLQKQIESLPKEYQEQLQPFITSAVKVQRQFSKRSPE